MVSIAEKIGCVPQTLHEWVKKAEASSGKRAGVPTEVADKTKALERQVRKLRPANEILRKASARLADRPSTYFGHVAQRQDPMRLSDFAYVTTWVGFAYVAFRHRHRRHADRGMAGEQIQRRGPSRSVEAVD